MLMFRARAVLVTTAAGSWRGSGGVQRRAFNKEMFERKRNQAPGLPKIDPYVAHGFDPARMRDTPDEVYGCMGIVAREGGIVSAQQMDNAMEIVENRIDMMREERRKKRAKSVDYDESLDLKVKAMRRDIGELVPVTKTTLASRLPAHLRQAYGGSSGSVAFHVYPVQAGTVLIELEANHPKRFSRELVTLLHLAMQEVGIPCAAMPRGLVQGQRWEMWQDGRLDDVFGRRRHRTPDGDMLLDHANGDYRLGNPGPRPLHAYNTRAAPRFRNEAEEEEFYRRAYLERTVTPKENSVSPYDIFGKKYIENYSTGVGEQRRIVKTSRFNKHQSCSKKRMRQWKSSRGK
eukprot:TRINITY_DN7725_c0_g1_i2.p1 TRINITY_DN7725_c0_g1~~TRINITY_DN7725_c0_g1_i2.p1  ORF type:complete len:372 (+),score=114.81 TRINITY_DN7725_c0_g1_i2:81-1118(+)